MVDKATSIVDGLDSSSPTNPPLDEDFVDVFDAAHAIPSMILTQSFIDVLSPADSIVSDPLPTLS